MPKISQSTLKYVEEFKYWKETAQMFFEIAQKQIDDAIARGDDDTGTVESIADAWHKCITAQWTLLKSGKQTANRMALRRGVDNRRYYPTQGRKSKTVENAVDKALEGEQG